MVSVKPIRISSPTWLSSLNRLVTFIMSFTLQFALSLICFYFTPTLKILLRNCTGLCELQRICYKTEKGAQRCLEVEKCIYASRRKVIKMIRNKLDDLVRNGRFNFRNTREVVQLVEHAVEAICTEKEIEPANHPEFVTAIRICLLQIYGYKNLQYEINHLRNEPVDIDNVKHEKRLVMIWETLNPEIPLHSMISNQWVGLGFTSEDPTIDFKGTGLLGLENLHYFTTNHTENARRILNHSKVSKNLFPFTLIGIGLTHIAINLLNDGRLKTHFYNSHFGTTCLEDFHKVYCYLFFTFHLQWIHHRPKDKLELSFMKEKFVKNLECELERNEIVLKWSQTIEV